MYDCFGLCCCCSGRGAYEEDEERRPLLPQYHDDTGRQAMLHSKVHTYQMLRAMGQGFMPSNEQAIVNLRTLLAAGLLNPDRAQDEHLSDSGRAAVHYARKAIGDLIELLLHKNSGDQVQDFVWYLSHAKLKVDVEDIASRASKATSRANTTAAYKSLQTVGSLLLTNPDFRIFLSDLGTVAREVFSDTALKLSAVSRQAAERLEPSQEEQESLLKRHETNGENGGGTGNKQVQDGTQAQEPPTEQSLGEEVAEVTNVLAEGAAEVAGGAQESLAEHLQGEEKDALFDRLKRVVSRLRQRPDYSSSVSTIALLLKRYALAYSHAVQDTVEAAAEDVRVDIDPGPMDDTDTVLTTFWTFVKTFGDSKEWDQLEAQLRRVVEKGREEDQDFDALVRHLGNSLQEMLMDPSFFDHAEERFEELRDQSRNLASRSSLREEIDTFLARLKSTLRSVLRDGDVSRLAETLSRLGRALAPPSSQDGGGLGGLINAELVADLINVFVPTLLGSVRFVPIPRLEVSTPDIDLLLENLILEPGPGGFLPNKLRVETRNNFEVRAGHSHTTSIVAIEIDGLSVVANDVGFWLRTRRRWPLLCLEDEGIASLHLGGDGARDGGGIDVRVEVEVGRDSLEELLALRSVHVAVRGLDYTLRRSRATCCAWLCKPFLLPLLNVALERQIGEAVASGVRAANRELLFARERLRAARIAAPADWITFIRAVAARLVPEPDPDLQARVGLVEGEGIFKGRYAPGSLVKIWNEEAERAGDRIREYERDGWRNGIFDVPTVPAMEH